MGLAPPPKLLRRTSEPRLKTKPPLSSQFFPMFDTICTLPLTSDLFTQAIHPTEPILSVGLAGGHVHTFRLPPAASDDSSDEHAIVSENGHGQIETVWRTRRHKGSCRSLSFGIDGGQLYSAGTDGLVKTADTTTGQVFAKIAVPLDTYAFPTYPRYPQFQSRRLLRLLIGFSN